MVAIGAMVVLITCLAMGKRQREMFFVLNDVGKSLVDRRCTVTGRDGAPFVFSDLSFLKKNGLNPSECAFIGTSSGLIDTPANCSRANPLINPPGMSGMQSLTFEPKKNACVVKGLANLTTSELTNYSERLMDNIAEKRPMVTQLRKDLGVAMDNLQGIQFAVNGIKTQACRRVRNGHSSIGCAQQMVEIDRERSVYRRKITSLYDALGKAVGLRCRMGPDTDGPQLDRCLAEARRVLLPKMLEDYTCASNKCFDSPSRVFSLCHRQDDGVYIRNNSTQSRRYLVTFREDTPAPHKAITSGPTRLCLGGNRLRIKDENGFTMLDLTRNASSGSGGPFAVSVTNEGRMVMYDKMFSVVWSW